MEGFKKIYLVDFAINPNDLRTANFEDDFDAISAANTLTKFFHTEDIKFLQIRIRYEKNDEFDK